MLRHSDFLDALRINSPFLAGECRVKPRRCDVYEETSGRPGFAFLKRHISRKVHYDANVTIFLPETNVLERYRVLGSNYLARAIQPRDIPRGHVSKWRLRVIVQKKLQRLHGVLGIIHLFIQAGDRGEGIVGPGGMGGAEVDPVVGPDDSKVVRS